MWVLLKQYNDYNQHGGYFAGIFDTEKQAIASVNHLGRLNYEETWYELIKINKNKIYDNEDE